MIEQTLMTAIRCDVCRDEIKTYDTPAHIGLRLGDEPVRRLRLAYFENRPGYWAEVDRKHFCPKCRVEFADGGLRVQSADQ